MDQTKKVFNAKFDKIWSKDKKTGLHLNNYANFHKFWFSSQKKREFPRFLRWRPKKRSSSQKLREFPQNLVWSHNHIRYLLQNLQKTALLTNSGVITSILGVSGLQLHSSSTEPVNFFGAQSSLGVALFSFGGHKQWFGRGTALECPPVAPGLNWNKIPWFFLLSIKYDAFNF